MAIIGPDKHGRYLIRWRDRSKKRHYEQLDRMPYRDVVKIHDQRMAERYRTPVSEAVTFRYIAAEYLRIHGPEMAPRAMIRATGILDNYALPAFGEEIVNDDRAIRRWPKIIKNWRNERARAAIAATGKSEPETRNREVNVVKAIFYFAVENGDIDMSPLPKGSVRSLKVARKAPIFLSPDEYLRFITGVPDVSIWRDYLARRRKFGVVKFTAEHDTKRRNGAGMRPDSDAADDYRERMLVFRGVWIGILESGGSRLSEILNLRWSQVDLRAGVAMIYQGKTGAPKAVPITPAWRADLESRPRGFGDTRVYTYRDGAPITDAQAARAFKIWREVAGLPRQFTIHKLRHTWASWATQGGAPDRQVQDGLGHADGRMTKKYAHLKPQHLATAFAAVTAMKETAATSGTTGEGDRT